MDVNSLWAEKYRPKTVEDIVLADDVREQLEKYRKEGTIPHLLLVGKPGVGKTTTGRVIINDVLGAQYLYINASDESGIDTIRNKVVSFAQTLSLTGDVKVVLLDECDGLTPDAQRALRNTMEEYSNHTRFILTANYGHRIIPAVKSRCTELVLNPPIKEVAKRMFSILKEEKIFVGPGKEGIILLVKQMYPDMRRMINHLQKCTIGRELKLKQSRAANETAKKVYDFIMKGSPLAARKYVISNEVEFDNDYPHLLKALLNVYYEECRIEEWTRNAAVLIAEHLYQSAFCMDQEINFTACVVKLAEDIS